TALSEAYQRAGKRGGRAVEDEKLYGYLREAATAIRNLTDAIQGRKPRVQPKHRGIKLLTLAGAGGGAALLLSRRESQNRSSDLSDPAARTATTDDPSQLAAA